MGYPMFSSSRSEQIRKNEAAEIARWFSPSPFGLLFHADDGRGWRVTPDQAQRWKADAMAVIDEHLAGQWIYAVLAVILMVVGVPVSVWIGQQFGISRDVAIGFGVGAGYGIAHFADMFALWLMSLKLREVRAGIVASMARVVPVPAEVAKAHQQRNVWRVALHIWVFAYVAVIMSFAHHFSGTFSSNDIATSGGVSAQMTWLIYVGCLAGLAIAWLLYWASCRVDEDQRR